MNELLRDFLTESAEQLDAIGAQLVRFEQEPSDARIVANIYRLVHSINGGCGFLALPRLGAIAHAAEALIARMRDAESPQAGEAPLVLVAVERIKAILGAVAQGQGEPDGDDSELIERIKQATAAPSAALANAPIAAVAWDDAFGPGPTPPERRVDTVRVSLATLERMSALASELVLTRNQIADATRTAPFDSIHAPLERLSTVTADLQTGVLATRMQPVEQLFASQRRLVNELSSELGKPIELILRGGDAELDRQLIETVRVPLAQLLRNAADHGIETPGDRLSAGKPQTAVIEVSARREAGHIVIEVADDGRGLDIEAIRQRACAMGLASRDELAAMAERELCRFVFVPGFSTSRQPSATSGRGVGLDVARTTIEAIGGSISLISRANRGVVTTIRIPLSLAVIPALIVRTGADLFAFPRHAIETLFEIDPSGEVVLEEVQGALMLRRADELTPAARLSALTASEPSDAAKTGDPMVALRMRSGARGLAIVVDEVVDSQEIVVNGLPRALGDFTMFSGAAVLGDGSVVLILDPPGLAAALGLPRTAVAVAEARGVESIRELERFVVFRLGGLSMALPLASVARVQPVRAGELGWAGGTQVLRRGDRLLPIVRLDHTPNPRAPRGERFALIVETKTVQVALLVDEVVDIVAQEPEIGSGEPKSGGVATLRGEATEILDAAVLAAPYAEMSFGLAADHGPAGAMILETSAPLREMYRRTLALAGHEAAFADDFDAAIDGLKRRPEIEFLFVDLDHGLRALHGRRPRAGRVKIVALAAHGGRTAQRAARQAGFAEAVGRFDRIALLNCLRGGEGEAAAA